jgi:hypothetical protein
MTSSVRLHVADHEKEKWEKEAEEMDISKAQYFRRMIRSGRRQWGYTEENDTNRGELQLKNPENTPTDSDSNIKTTIKRNLSTTEGVSEEEIAEIVYQDLADQIGELLVELKEEGEADYDPTKGGWIKR